MKSSKTRAKAVIYQIVQMSEGDRIEGRVRLSKAFYFAHLYYAKSTGRYLSDWPIVRMPFGPGIHEFDSLLAELVNDGQIRMVPIEIGPYPSTLFVATGSTVSNLDKDALESIREAVAFVSRKSCAELSDITHEHSRSWRNASKDGESLDVYADLLDDDTYSRRMQLAEELSCEKIPELSPERIRESIEQMDKGQLTSFDEIWSKVDVSTPSN
jgi:uncharacterized phage-associated protein